MPMPVQLMAKAIILDRQGRILLLAHPSRNNELFFPGGRLINPRTGERYRMQISHPKELGDVAKLFPGASRESGAKAVRRRILHEFRDFYKILPNLSAARIHVEYSWPAFMRIEPDSDGVQTVYVYLMSRVRLSGRSIRTVTRAFERDPSIGAYATVEEALARRTPIGQIISPNVLPVLQEIRLAPRSESPANTSGSSAPPPPTTSKVSA